MKKSKEFIVSRRQRFLAATKRIWDNLVQGRGETVKKPGENMGLEEIEETGQGTMWVAFFCQAV